VSEHEASAGAYATELIAPDLTSISRLRFTLIEENDTDGFK